MSDVKTDEDVSPKVGDHWCGHCKRWVAKHHVSLSHTHDGCSDEGCGYQVYSQDHPCFGKGLPTAERARHG
jgi:hypothetical protein